MGERGKRERNTAARHREIKKKRQREKRDSGSHGERKRKRGRCGSDRE